MSTLKSPGTKPDPGSERPEPAQNTQSVQPRQDSPNDVGLTDSGQRSLSEPAFDHTAADYDPILAAIIFLAHEMRRPSSRDVMLAGLPLSNGKLTPELIPRVLERIGLAATVGNGTLDGLAAFDMPVIMADKTGGIVVCAGRNADSEFVGFDPDKAQRVTFSNRRFPPAKKRDFLHIKLLAEDVELPDSTNDNTNKGHQTHWLRTALAGHGKGIANVILATVLINLFAIAMPLFTLNVYDRVLPNKAISTLWVLAIGLAIVLVFDLILKVVRGSIIDFVGRNIDFSLSSVMFDRVLNATLAERPTSTGAFANRIAQYEVLRDFFTSSTVVMFIDILFMGLFAYVIGSLIGWVVIFPLIATLIALLVTTLIGFRAGAAVKSALQESAGKNAVLFETLAAVQTVKATRSEGHFLSRWENAVLKSSETQHKIKSLQSIASNFTAVAGQLAMISIIIGGAYRFSASEISMGAIIASMMLSNRLIAPVAQISSAILRTRGALEAYRVLGQVMALPDERTKVKNFVNRKIQAGRIDFSKVRFAYPGAKQFVLDQVSFSVAPGEKVGIVGRIGSGKTTIGRLLVGFYEPDEGEILVDGVAIGQYHPAHLRTQVGFVLQDPELFNGTVRENIVLSDPTASEDRMIDVAGRAGVEDFVSRHPLGFDMPVGERGNLLSGGQRQAIALARAMLTNPKILFLDEPSSSMDLATERQLIDHLAKSLAPDHTVLIATHRHSLLALVSRLIVIDNGRIIADGPRDAVLAQLKARGSAQ